MSISIKSSINAKNIKVGRGVVIEDGVIITGKGGPAEDVILGDYCYIGQGTKIIVPEFRLGDYTKLHAQSFVHGQKPMRIGRNCWFGGNTVLDSQGGLDIDDGVGVGAHSQLWTHIQFGDIVEGSRFYSSNYMYVGKDAWFVGHCIVSPVKVGEKSMALAGSVITKDMESNHIYGGSPAKDLTGKVGTQFEERTIEQKVDKLEELIVKFESKHPEFINQFRVITSDNDIISSHCCFNVVNRTYTKRHTPAEVAFLKAHVPLIKFVPHDEGSFIGK